MSCHIGGIYTEQVRGDIMSRMIYGRGDIMSRMIYGRGT